MKKHIVAAALLMLAVPAIAGAVELKGKWGPGYFHNDFPLGIRCWVSENMGVDAGLMIATVSGGGGADVSQFGLDAGLPIVIKNGENAIFYFRPGFEYASLDGAGGIDSQFIVRGSLGIEYWFTPNFSIGAAHGIGFGSISPTVGDSVTGIFSEAFGVGDIGAHWYFGGGE
jgi:hypothetical protein